MKNIEYTQYRGAENVINLSVTGLYFYALYCYAFIVYCRKFMANR